jgi:hypothetical protein
LVVLYFWRGPYGRDGAFYADPALLSEPRAEIAIRYVHVYAVAGMANLFGSVTAGAGMWALFVYLAAVAMVWHVGLARDSATALLGASLAATCPLFLGVATVPMTDLPSALMALGSLLAILMAPKLGWPATMASGVLLVLGVRAKETAVFVAPALFIVMWSLRPPGRARAALWFAIGCVVCLLASMALDAWIIGDPLWTISGRTGTSYLGFNLRSFADLGKPTLLDEAANRWLAGYCLIAAAGVVGGRNHPMWMPLSVASAVAAVAQAWSLSMADFGAEDRYLIPILLPLLPLGATWLTEQLREGVGDRSAFSGREWASIGAVLSIAALITLKLAPRFPRNAFNQLLPVLWAVVVAASLALPASRKLRALLATFLIVLLGATTGASLYSMRQMALHVDRANVQWTRLAHDMEPFRDQVIGIAAPDEPTLERSLRIHSGWAGWRLRRVTDDGWWPSVVLADPQHARAAETRGLVRMSEYGPLTFTPLVLLRVVPSP